MPSLRKFLFEDEAVIGIKSPSDYPYLKILRYALSIVVSWPSKEIGRYENERLTTVMKYFYFLETILCLIGCVMYTILHISTLSFLRAGHLYLSILMTLVDMSRVGTLTLSAKYREIVKDYLTKFHLFFYKDQSEFAMKTHRKVHLVCHIYTMFLTLQMCFGIFLFHILSVYNNYAAGNYESGNLKNSTFEQALYFSYPFDAVTNVTGYIVACILNWIISTLCVNWFCMFDLLLFVMAFHIWGHFNILINNLDNFPKPSSTSRVILENGLITRTEMYSEEELMQVSDKLKECINHHRSIISFTDRITKVFGPMLFVYYVFHQLSMCLLLVECSQMTADALIRYLPLTYTMLQQLIQLSVIFELIGSASGKLKNSVYGIPWECMDTKNKTVVAFFLMNVQKPVHVKAMRVADVGVTSMASIIKTSLSFFTFLRTVQ